MRHIADRDLQDHSVLTTCAPVQAAAADTPHKRVGQHLDHPVDFSEHY